MRPDLWPSLGIVITNLDAYLGSALQLEGEKNIHVPCVGSELHAAPSAPQNPSSSLSSLPPFRHRLTPSRARIRCVEKALPLSGAPPRTDVLSLRSHRARMKKTCRKQGECHPYWATHLRSLRTLTLSGLRTWPRMRTLGKSNPRASTRTNEGERCRSRALHQPWPKELPASDPLARLRQPPPLSPRRWSSGRNTRPGADVKSTSHRLRRCRRRASATQKRHHASTNPDAPRRYHQTASANMAQRHDTAQTRANTSPIGRRESCRAKMTCPLGRDQAPGGPAGERTVDSKRPVEAMDHHRGVHPSLIFEARREGAESSWKMQRRRRCKASQRGRLVAVTPGSRAVTRVPGLQ